MAGSSSESAAVAAVLDAIATGAEPDRAVLRDVVRLLLSVLREKAPGRSVEVRVPPFGAVQCVPGPRHTRGTPPNVIELDPVTFVLVATNRLRFAEGVSTGRIRASGIRADLSEYLPLWAISADPNREDSGTAGRAGAVWPEG